MARGLGSSASFVARGRLLPLGNIRGNRCSFLGIDNVCSAILRIAIVPFPNPLYLPCTCGNPKIYHLTDKGVISTRRLVEVLSEGHGCDPWVDFGAQMVSRCNRDTLEEGTLLPSVCSEIWR